MICFGDTDGYELVMSNIMRQVLEAFSTFQYKKVMGGFYRSKYISNTTRKRISKLLKI